MIVLFISTETKSQSPYSGLWAHTVCFKHRPSSLSFHSVIPASYLPCSFLSTLGKLSPYSLALAVCSYSFYNACVFTTEYAIYQLILSLKIPEEMDGKPSHLANM